MSYPSHSMQWRAFRGSLAGSVTSTWDWKERGGPSDICIGRREQQESGNVNAAVKNPGTSKGPYPCPALTLWRTWELYLLCKCKKSWPNRNITLFEKTGTNIACNRWTRTSQNIQTWNSRQLTYFKQWLAQHGSKLIWKEFVFLTIVGGIQNAKNWGSLLESHVAQ